MINLTVALCFFSFISFGGCYNENIIAYPQYYKEYREVRSLINENYFDEGITLFDSISKMIPHVPSHHYLKIAQSSALFKRCDLSSKYLEKALINGLEYGKGMGTNKTIDLCDNEINTILAKEAEIHMSNFNMTYKAIIDSMIVADQEYRSSNFDSKNGNIDSLNMVMLLKCIDKYGYPGERLIGHSSAFNAFIIILHMDRDKNNRIFKPIIDEAYNSGQLWPNGYAWIVDRRRAWGEDDLEPYYYHMPSNIYDDFSVEMKREIDRRRDSIGLSPKIR